MFTTRPEIAATFGVACSTHWIASQVAMAVLERGGNAFDAAVAAGFTLQVAEPHLNGPGGDVPIILHAARTGTQHVVCGQAGAPGAATVERFGELGLDLIPATGLLPAVVPGAFDAWLLMLRDWGTWELRDVLAYAIGYARDGVHIVPNVSAAIESVRTLFEQHWPSSAEVFLPHGKVPGAGSLFARPALAATWERLLRESAGAPNREARIDAARDAWYRGFVAEAIGRFYREQELMDVSGRRHPGFLTADDCARWRAPVEPALTYDYGPCTVLKCGPWSQGPVFLQQLALLRHFDVAAMDPLGPEFIHTVVECAKLAYADREAYYGDPDFVEVPLDVLLSDTYNAGRAALVGTRASMALRPGQVPGMRAFIEQRATAGPATAAGAGEPTVARLGVKRGDTCHLDVIDRWGNMVSATPSGGWLQSSPVIPELGFCLSTRGQMFSLTPGLPNTLAPHKRPRTTLTPSFALRDGRAWMAFGTPGGEQQDQWSLTFFLRMVAHGMNIQQAIDAPSFHTEHWPSSFWPRLEAPGKVVIEGRYADAVLQALRDAGHLASKGDDWSEGRLSAARIEPDGQMYGGANPRGMQGYAVGR
ncbi:gamma-glutamyltransferase family protein [Verticiella sediminum]|uniref:Gamma-glutamyltransferase family protein n=1 Tax=Verticiella sediminum TaxID=1247510 RepID=A0A556ACG3_9BURK|nr:gamma-glutamyltransferase family protein [Verticiella sediminum]TSH90582.1 gamma-glutamyltransferase family protein [Verticiella sediminum]